MSDIGPMGLIIWLISARAVQSHGELPPAGKVGREGAWGADQPPSMRERVGAGTGTALPGQGR